VAGGTICPPRWEKDPPDFERFEHELHERIMALECELLTAELARYDVDVEQLEVRRVQLGKRLLRWLI
jgi:hypothetical protein